MNNIPDRPLDPPESPIQDRHVHQAHLNIKKRYWDDMAKGSLDIFMEAICNADDSDLAMMMNAYMQEEDADAGKIMGKIVDAYLDSLADLEQDDEALKVMEDERENQKNGYI